MSEIANMTEMMEEVSRLHDLLWQRTEQVKTLERVSQQYVDDLAAMTAERARLKKFTHWVRSTPSKGLSGDSRVAFDAQVRLLNQLEHYLTGQDDYLEAACKWSLGNKPLYEDLRAQLAAAQARSAEMEEALKEQRTQMSYPGLPEAFALTMKRMIDKAITPTDRPPR